MKWLRLFVLGLMIAVGVAGGLALTLRERLRAAAEGALTEVIEREASLALGVPLRLDALRLDLGRLAVETAGVALGPDGAVGRVGAVRVRLLPRTSWRQRRPVLDVEAAALRLDLPMLLQALPPPSLPAVPMPAFRLRRLAVRDVEVTLVDGAVPLRIGAGGVDGQVTADAATGRLRFALRAAPALLHRGARTLTFTTAAARGGERADGWWLQALELAGDGVALRGEGEADALPLRGSIDLARLAVLEPTLQRLGGAAGLEVRLEGPLAAARLRGAVRVPDLVLDGRVLGVVETELDLDAERLQVTSAQLRGCGGALRGRGTLQFDAALTYQARLDWSGLAVRDLAALAGVAAPAVGADGEGEVSGALEPWRIEATGTGRLRPPRGAPVTWSGRGRWAGDSGGGSLELAQGAANRLGGDVRLGPRGALAGTVRVALADPDGLRGVLPLESLPDVRGALDASAEVSGTLDDPRLVGAVNGRDLRLGGARVTRLAGGLSADRRAARSDGLVADIGGGRVTLSGTLALDATTANAWSVRGSGIDGGAVTALVDAATGVALPIAGGALSLEGRGVGPWSSVVLDGTARLEKFWLGREQVRLLEATMRAAGGRWTLEAAAHNRAREHLGVRASGRGGEDLVIDVTGAGWQLASLWDGEAAEMGGTLRAFAALRGRAAALDGRALLAADDLVLAGRRFGTIEVAVTATRGLWDARAALLDGALQAQAQVRPQPGLPFTVAVDWRDADVAPLISARPELHVASSGTVRAEGRLSAPAQLEARLELTGLALTGGAYAATADVPVTASCRAGICRLERLTLRVAEGTLTVGGEVGFDGRVQLRLDGGGRLALLELLGEPIHSARGTFTVDAQVEHGAAGWGVLGGLSFDQAGLDVGLPAAVTRASGRLRLDGSTVRVEQLSGRLGTGSFEVGGSIDLRAGPALTWTLTDVGMDPIPSLELETSGSGTLDGSWDQLRLAGDVTVQRLLYDRRIELAEFLPTFNRALAAAPRRPDGRELQFALHIVAPGELYVENNLARLEARADLRLSGTADRPVLDGRIEALDGEVYFRGRTLDLVSATVDFRPDLGLAAALNITAESLIDTPEASYLVGARVTGTTQNPRVSLSSDDPSLSQTDIATLITLGRTTAQLREGGGGFSVYDALGIVPGQVADALEGTATRLLPIDSINFEPTFSPVTGAFEPQLKLGKNLTDDLTASLSQTFGVSSRTRVEVDYRLGPRVSIPVSWESQTEKEAGAFAGGIRMRYEFWRLTPYTLLRDLR